MQSEIGELTSNIKFFSLINLFSFLFFISLLFYHITNKKYFRLFLFQKMLVRSSNCCFQITIKFLFVLFISGPQGAKFSKIYSEFQLNLRLEKMHMLIIMDDCGDDSRNLNVGIHFPHVRRRRRTLDISMMWFQFGIKTNGTL